MVHEPVLQRPCPLQAELHRLRAVIRVQEAHRRPQRPGRRQVPPPGPAHRRRASPASAMTAVLHMRSKPKRMRSALHACGVSEVVGCNASIQRGKNTPVTEGVVRQDAFHYLPRQVRRSVVNGHRCGNTNYRRISCKLIQRS